MSSPIRPPLWITEADGNPSGRPINKIVVSNGTLTINGTTATITTGGAGGDGTVTNVSSSDSFISITNPNTTPSITIQDATTSQDGILTSTDWNTFNNKTSNSGTVTSVGSSQAFVSVASATTTPSITIGNASGSATGVLTSTDWTTFNNKGSGDGTVTSVGSSQAFVSVASATTTPSITIGEASGSATGVLTSTDWTTFNNKTSNTGTVTGTGSANQISYWTAASVQAGSTGLTYDPSTGNLTVGGYVETGTKVTTPSGTNLELTTGSASSGSMVIADGANGQISITPNGTGTIKLDGVELDNSAIATGYVLKATSATAAGWASESGGTTSPAGSNTQVQFNDNGSFGANNKMQYTAASGVLTLTNYAQFNNVVVGYNSGVITTSTQANLKLQPYYGISAGIVEIGAAANSNITLTPDGTGEVHLRNFKFDVDQTVGAGQDNYVLTYDNTTDLISLEAAGGGGVTFPIEADSGSTGAPSYSFSADTDTGIFLSGASNMGLVAGGVSYINIGSLGIVELTRRLRNTAGSAALPSYSFSGDSDTGFWSSNPDEISLSLGGSRLYDFRKISSSANIRLRGGAPIINCDEAGADLSLRSGGSTYAEILIQNENSNIDIKPAGTGKVKISDAYTLPSAVTTTNDFVLTAQTDGSTAWAASSGGSAYPVTGATAINANDDTWIITSFAPFPRSVLSTSSQSIDTSVYYIGFIPPKDITLTNLQVNVTVAGTGNLSMALYNSDAVGNPKNLLSNSTVTLDASSTGYFTSTMASSQSLSGLNLYYLAITMSANSCTVRSHPSNSGWAIAPVNGLDTFNRALLYDGTTLTFPSTVTASQLSTKYGFTPLIGGGF
jgi:hypothetical protein